MRTFRGLTYDRCASAYTSKRKPRRPAPTRAGMPSDLTDNLEHSNEDAHRSRWNTSSICIEVSDCQGARRLNETSLFERAISRVL